MTDREIIEYAALATGEYHGEWSKKSGSLRIRSSGRWQEWNPLTDDGDAMRLAVRLGLRVGTDGQSLYPHIECWRAHYDTPRVFEPCSEDPYAATRRAIVRAAAEIGKNIG
jgi:hypothetical protein